MRKADLSSSIPSLPLFQISDLVLKTGFESKKDKWLSKAFKKSEEVSEISYSLVGRQLKKLHCYHFVGHRGAFYGLKWRIWRAKMYFSPLK